MIFLLFGMMVVIALLMFLVGFQGGRSVGREEGAAQTVERIQKVAGAYNGHAQRTSQTKLDA